MKDHAWYFPTIEKFRHLLDNSICFCGSGMNDIAFMCHTSYISNKLSENNSQLSPDDLIIFINKKPLKIEFAKEPLTIIPSHHPTHQAFVPSLNPPKKNQILKLEKTRVNWHYSEMTKLDSVLHELLEIAHNEQDLYNKVTYELVRQATVNCIERGKLLSKLRDKFRDDLSNITLFTKKFHDKLMAQRLVDNLARLKMEKFLRKNEEILSLFKLDEDEGDLLKADLKTRINDFKFTLSESTSNSELMSQAVIMNSFFRKTIETESRNISAQNDLWNSIVHSLLHKIISERKYDNIKVLNNLKILWREKAVKIAEVNKNSALEDLRDCDRVLKSISQQLDNLHDRFKTQTSQSLKISESIKNKMKNSLSLTSPETLRDELLNDALEMFSFYSGDYLILSIEMVQELTESLEIFIKLCRTLTRRYMTEEQEKYSTNKFLQLQYEIVDYLSVLKELFVTDNKFSTLSSKLIVRVENSKNVESLNHLDPFWGESGENDREMCFAGIDLTTLIKLDNKLRFLFASFSDDINHKSLAKNISDCYNSMVWLGINISLHIFPTEKVEDEKILERAKSMIPTLSEIKESWESISSHIDFTNLTLTRNCKDPSTEDVDLFSELNQLSREWSRSISEELGKLEEYERIVKDKKSMGQDDFHAKRMFFITNGGYIDKWDVRQVSEEVEINLASKDFEELQQNYLKEEKLAAELEEEVSFLEREIMEIKKQNLKIGMELMK